MSLLQQRLMFIAHAEYVFYMRLVATDSTLNDKEPMYLADAVALYRLLEEETETA